MTDPYIIASASGLASAVFVAGFCAAVLWDMRINMGDQG